MNAGPDLHDDDLVRRLGALVDAQPVAPTTIDLADLVQEERQPAMIGRRPGWVLPAMAVVVLIALAVGVATLLPVNTEPDVADGIRRSLGTGDAWSVEGALAAVPAAAADEEVSLTMADLDTLADQARTRPPLQLDPDSVLTWQEAIGDQAGLPPAQSRPDSQPGGNRGTAARQVGLTTVRLPASFGLPRYDRLPAFRDEVGWTVADLSAFVAVEAVVDEHGDWQGIGPFTAGLARDRSDLPDDATIRLGTGDGLAADLDAVTPARPNGAALSAVVDGRDVALSATSDATTAWAQRDGTSLAADPVLVAVARALDDVDALSATIERRPIGVVGRTGGSVDGNPVATPGAAHGVGWSVTDGQPRMHVVLDLGDPATARRRVDEVRAFWSTSSPDAFHWSSVVSILDATARGRIVRVDLAVTETGTDSPWGVGGPRAVDVATLFAPVRLSRTAPFGTTTGPLDQADFTVPDLPTLGDLPEPVRRGSGGGVTQVGWVGSSGGGGGFAAGPHDVTLACVGAGLLDVRHAPNTDTGFVPVPCDGSLSVQSIALAETSPRQELVQVVPGPGWGGTYRITFE